MRGIYVADVGDGLCLAISTISGEVVQVDCGGQKAEEAFRGLRRILNHFGNSDVFILSHFHIDHYNGLLYASVNLHRYPSFRITEVYFPRIPEFKEKEEFFCDLMTMNMRVFGSETGVMEYDLLRAMSKINRGAYFRSKPLSKGDSININGSIFRIVWPPKVIDDKRTLADVKRALKDFEKALEEDETTRQYYNLVREEGIFKDYLERQGERRELQEYDKRSGYARVNTRERRRLPAVVKKANKSLRKAANHLSLALFEDNRLLFLGDTENFEIRQIVDDLKSMHAHNFYVFILPHHGTHWHNSLRQIRCIYSIASNGSKLCAKMNHNFKEISARSFATFVSSDIVIPIYPIMGFWQGLPWFL